MLKFIALRRIEKERKVEARRLEKEKEKLEGEEKEKEFQQSLEIVKKGEFLLNYCPNVYINKVGKKLDDYDFKEVWVTSSGHKQISEVVLDAKAYVVGVAKKMGAEVIVDMKPSISYSSDLRVVYMTGTALIPKKKK